jgi:hypothetical protein
MRWEDSVLAMLDDLEMQADGLELVERAVEVGELSVAQYAELALVARLHGCLGDTVRIALADGLEVRGRLARTGSDWLLLEDVAGGAWIVPLAAAVVVSGLGSRSVPGEARPFSAKLSLGSVLRGLAERQQHCALHLRGGRVLHGTLARVGADFVDLQPDESLAPVTVPLAALAVVQDRA